MGKITLTQEQKAELQREDVLFLEQPNLNRPGTGTFHNPVTGREIYNQPMDMAQWSRKLAKGWKTGPASPELREKYKIREAELRVEDDKREADYLASHEHEVDTRTRYNEDVKSAVLAVLDQLGVDLPVKSGAEPTKPAPAPEDNPEGKQLSLFAPEGAPSESDPKHVVSQAPQPALHLVE